MRNFFVLLIFLNYRQGQTSCPVLCDQNSCSSGILFCSDIGLETIPEIPPPKTTKIIIKNQRFRNPILGYRNLSKYGPEEINLRHLTIQNCGITEIESESFSHLIHLNEMDLSHNNLLVINPKTFKALNLKSLKLDGNKILKIIAASFQGLVVSSLSLSNCGLSSLTFDSIKEISGHLIRFNLSKNNLKTLNLKFYLLFKRLEEIRLEENRLKCDCRIKWLNKILKDPKHAVSSRHPPIMCFYPIEMRGKIISNLAESSLVCPKPDLKTISVDISSKSAVLYCSSASNSDTQVSWHFKHLHNNSIYKTQDLIETPNNASIRVLKKTPTDKFACIVSNENGNISVELNIRWPEELGNKSIESATPMLMFPPSNSSNPFNSNQLQYLYIKQFTFLEMILSIGSTFVVTTITFSLIYLFISRKISNSSGKHSPSKCRYQSVMYSETQREDSPRYSTPHKSYHPSAQLIDFKTQKPLT